MLEAIGLTKRYGNQIALHPLDLRIEPGEIYCLLGANGAGKTTTVNLFLNFIAPDGGQALINGLDVTREPLASKRHVAYIPEQVNLYGTLTGLENLRYFSALALGEAPSRERLLALLAEVGLDPAAADKRVAAYSKGMRQKVWIAVALAKNARALLLDEPTSGLDPSAAEEFTRLLQRAANQGVAILATTHDLFHARQTATRVGIMKRGRLVESLDARQIGDVDLQALYLAHMRAEA
ncbi:ABC transporter ATP-binding protein [Achromobacter arsenitoxydans]|uniref:Multidrug ABC transporter ATP-binding protein n=1 Tax=Achromobacter arsenitoxydans SY8 TaxID=477184 RepID=H0F2D7_9BURK|nr:ABC transporter ATP-binding protein [Achromobacter arsenitoxydans]EHK67548.1 multidrug ABC transporter ATP-binding protein [Achromobacter arsenitoxydans SY8]